MALSPLPASYYRAQSSHQNEYSGKHISGVSYSYSKGTLTLDNLPKNAHIQIKRGSPAKGSPYVEILVNGRLIERMPASALKNIAIKRDSRTETFPADPKSFKLNVANAHIKKLPAGELGNLIDLIKQNHQALKA